MKVKIIDIDKKIDFNLLKELMCSLKYMYEVMEYFYHKLIGVRFHN